MKHIMFHLKDVFVIVVSAVIGIALVAFVVSCIVILFQ